jgi:hypothetical protein
MSNAPSALIRARGPGLAVLEGIASRNRCRRVPARIGEKSRASMSGPIR